MEPDPATRTDLELTVALAYAVDAMAEQAERHRASGRGAAADLIAVQLRVIEDHRRGLR